MPDAEQQLIRLVNQDRAAKGLPALQPDGSLARVAREGSRHMAEAGYISHNLPGYGPLRRRLAKAGYDYRVARENVGRADNIAEVEEAFLRSPEHADNLFAPDVTRIGIGIVPAANGRQIYVTQIFATPVQHLPAEAAGRLFVEKIQDARRRKGLPPIAASQVFQKAAQSAAQKVPVPFSDRDVSRVLAAAKGDLSREPDITTFSVDAQLIHDPAELHVPDQLLQKSAKVMGTAVRQMPGNQQQFLILTFIGL